MLTAAFFISGAVTFGLIAVKAYEVRQKRTIFVTRVIAMVDERFSGHRKKVIVALEGRKEAVTGFVVNEAPRRVKYALFILRKEAKDRYDAIVPALRGIRILKKRGNVSTFLKDIARYKEEQGGGEIQDRLDDPYERE
jgi:hypothetical protein